MYFQLKPTTLVLISLIAGCGVKSDAPQLSKAHGVVTYKNRPLSGAQVLFTPVAGPFAIGETNEEGRFILFTGGKEGASLGEHKVTVSAFEPVETMDPATEAAGGIRKDEGKPLISRIPAKYGNLKLSTLTATVTESEANEFQFDLK